MINEHTVKQYCNGDITCIENYHAAIDDINMWDCHHRMEIQPDGTTLSQKWMIAHDIYFNLDPCMLIFLKREDHMHLHAKNKDLSKFIAASRMKNHKHSEHAKAKMSASAKGNKSLTGRHWYNNGVSNIAAFECPTGFVPGKLVNKRVK